MGFITENNLGGIVIGLCTFVVIGVFHPVVIKAYHRFGIRCWWFFLLLGIASLAGSLAVAGIIWSSMLGVLGFTSFWTVKELFEQRQRVRKGWFPDNPGRKR